ncbi:MAG TPA: DUF4032 domain-containing protein [Anaerolineales bacterium]
MANQDFERAFSRAFWRKVLARLTGANNELLPYDEVRARLPLWGQHYLGVQQVPIDRIVGSQGRYLDFDRAFLPVQSVTKDRWVSIDKAHLEQVELPPVELYKMGDAYFVKDGNHRISVARQRDQLFVDAYVTEIDIPVDLPPDFKLVDLALKQKQAEFLLATHLAELRPGAQFEASQAGAYDQLLEHISVHRWYLGEQRQADVPFSEAAASWYDTVYHPLVEFIREQGILKNFPGFKEAELYLWVMEYQSYLRQAQLEEAAGDETARAEAARHLALEHPLPAVRKLVQVLIRTSWAENLILSQERAAFFEQTHLLELRPTAKIELTLPGQYDKLREHIAAHRWYLGEQRYREVPYPEAVVSWYDNVYSPLYEIISEQDILKEFPGRTAADLYLWIIEHQWYLQQAYGGEVPIEQAAEQYTQGYSRRRKAKRK